jgi:hypothetical protein
MACVVASVRMPIKREDSSKNPVKNFRSFFELNSYSGAKLMAPIRQTLKRLLSKSYREQLKMEADTRTYLNALPTCHQFVLIAAPEYGEGERR